jgi:hypothetical protein
LPLNSELSLRLVFFFWKWSQAWAELHLCNWAQTWFLFFLGKFAITLKFELELGFELGYFLNIKTWNQRKGWIPSFYVKLIVFLLRCVEISYGLQALFFFLHKKIHKSDIFKNEHLYTCLYLSTNFLLGETLKNVHKLFL